VALVEQEKLKRRIGIVEHIADAVDKSEQHEHGEDIAATSNTPVVVVQLRNLPRRTIPGPSFRSETQLICTTNHQISLVDFESINQSINQSIANLQV
jgi:hypothetical protein